MGGSGLSMPLFVRFCEGMELCAVGQYDIMDFRIGGRRDCAYGGAVEEYIPVSRWGEWRLIFRRFMGGCDRRIFGFDIRRGVGGGVLKNRIYQISRVPGQFLPTDYCTANGKRNRQIFQLSEASLKKMR